MHSQLGFLVASIAAVSISSASLDGSAPVRIAAGPVLAGKGVIWAEDVQSTVSLRLGRQNARPELVARFQSSGFVKIAGSQSRFVVARSGQVCAEGQACVSQQDALGGPPTGPLRRIARFRSCTAQNPSQPSVDSHREVVAYAETRCSPPRLAWVPNTRSISISSATESWPF